MDKVDKYTRCRPLFGDNFENLQKKKILLLGVGGVGSFCLEGLYRTGITDITIVDFDTYDVTNQNRQLGSDKIGMIKVERLKEIYPNVEPLNLKITPEWIEKQDFSKYDLVIDAIDDMKAKVALAKHLHVKLVSSMGGAKKLDPTHIKSDSIWKTQGDPLAKKFRSELRKDGFDGDFDVVYSNEQSICSNLGSFVGVTGSMGLALCSLAVRKLLKN